MIFREDVLSETGTAYRRLTEYYRDIRAFFEVLSVRFALPEYGVRLRPVAGNELFSNANTYLLSDDSAYPYYLWTPTWLGRSYVDAEQVGEGQAVDDLRTSRARLIAFVWPWLGFNDAYVDDAAQPECWFGVAQPEPEDEDETVRVTAQSLFNYFRLEKTFEAEAAGWLTGRFHSNPYIGCNLTGHWFLRRVPLSSLTSYYQVEKNVIRPLGEKFAALRPGHAAPVRNNGHRATALDVVTPPPR
ncbi:hypothetical protein AB0G02_35725 [Actinosynnema sp. NPDC023658]|uniref:hypothetical protein n=1 Tax=Actinosynnema sp. NPDC023658 TaxID=3155465 RepID=UPI0033D468BD